MRLVLVSTHTDQTTGYSKVVHNLLKQLASLTPKVKVFHFGFQRHPNRPSFRKLPAGIMQYDAAANEDPKEEGFGFNKINEYLEMVNPDVVMVYNDALIVDRFIQAMKHDKNSSRYKLWVYLDLVYNGVAQPLMDSIQQHADRVYTFTDIWKQKLNNYGNFSDIRILEHGVDNSLFTNLPSDARISIRSNIGIPSDAVVFINANRNSQRKRLDLTLMGFANLLAKNPDKPYYLIIATNAAPQTGAHYDIARIFLREIAKYNLDQRCVTKLIVIDTAGENTIADEGINQLYNAADIGINTSDGEGFGLCQLEHMLTGAPQIVTDVGSYRSFLNDEVATFIKPNGEAYFAGSMPLGAWTPTFAAEDVANAMETTINNLEKMKETVGNYKFKTWSNVCDSWLEDVMTA